MNYSDGIKRADEILTAIRPFCHRAELAGSLRRGKQTDVKDIEICLMANTVFARELADVVNHKWGDPTMGKFPAKYTKIRAIANIDFFTCVNPDAWGLLFVIRTGPAPFGERLLTFWKTVTNGGFSKDCILHLADGTPVPCREEQDVFDALAKYSGKPCPFIAPEKRLAVKGRK